MIDKHRLIAALGGVGNIETLEPCITRLRIEVRRPEDVDRLALRSAGGHGVSAAGRVVQVVVGPNADTLASDLEDELWPDGEADDDAAGDAAQEPTPARADGHESPASADGDAPSPGV